MSDLWDIQEGETSKSYVAFTEYLRLGYKRSLEKTAKVLNLKTHEQIALWSRLYNWQERARAYDAAKAKKILDDSINQAAETSQDILAYISLLFKTLLEKGFKDKELKDLPIKELSYIGANFMKHYPNIVEMRNNTLNDLLSTLGADSPNGINLLDKLKENEDARAKLDEFIKSF